MGGYIVGCRADGKQSRLGPGSEGWDQAVKAGPTVLVVKRALRDRVAGRVTTDHRVSPRTKLCVFDKVLPTEDVIFRVVDTESV